MSIVHELPPKLVPMQDVPRAVSQGQRRVLIHPRQKMAAHAQLMRKRPVHPVNYHAMLVQQNKMCMDSASQCLQLLRRVRLAIARTTSGSRRQVIEEFGRATKFFSALDAAARQMTTVDVRSSKAAVELSMLLDGEETSDVVQEALHVGEIGDAALDSWFIHEYMHGLPSNLTERNSERTPRVGHLRAFYKAFASELSGCRPTRLFAANAVSLNMPTERGPVEMHRRFKEAFDEYYTKSLRMSSKMTVHCVDDSPFQTTMKVLCGIRGESCEFYPQLRAYVNVIGGCFVNFTFLGPNEDETDENGSMLWESSMEVCRLLSKNANHHMFSMVTNEITTIPYLMNLFSLIQHYMMCFSTKCSVCGKVLRDWVPPTCMIRITPPVVYMHEVCLQNSV